MILRYLLMVSIVSFSTPAQAVDIPVKQFRTVNEGLYRGARPNLEGLRALKKLGIRTILNIENHRSAVDFEIREAKKLGMEVISIPLSWFWAPSDKDTARIQAILADTSLYPLFFHCKYGQDRTGLMAGLFRVFHDGWTPERAYREMLINGFHPEFVFLNQYFEDKVGWDYLSSSRSSMLEMRAKAVLLLH